MTSHPSSDSPSPPSLSKRLENHLLAIGCTVAILLLSAIWLSWSPAERAMKRFWGRKHASEALEAMQNQNWVLAFRSLADARRWAPQDTEVLTAVIAVLDASKADPGGLAQTLETLGSLQPLTDAQRIMLADSLISTGKTIESWTAFEKISADEKSKSAALEVLAKLLKADGHEQESRKVAQQALQADTESPEIMLQRAVAERLSPFAEVAERAMQELWRIAKLETAVALSAIRQLASERSLMLPQAQLLLDLVENHPHKSSPDRFAVLSALMRLQPETRDTVFTREIQRFKDKGDSKLEPLALWLAREKQYPRLMKLVPPQLALHSQELFPVIAQALAEERRWPELKTLLTSEHPPISESKLSISLALVQSHLSPGTPEVSQYLESGIRVAIRDRDAETLIDAAALADKLTLPELAMRAYLAIAAFDANKAVTVLQGAYEEAVILKDARMLLDISRKLHALRPTSTVYASRLMYLRLVIGEEMERVNLDQVAATSVTPLTSSDQMPLALLRSLAAYRVADRKSMLEYLAHLPDTTTLPVGARAVAAGLLSLAGKPDRAWQIAERIPETLLLDEEVTFLKRAK